MKRGLLALALCLSACDGPPPAPAAQLDLHPDEWLTFGGTLGDTRYAAIALHDTPLGLAGVLIGKDDAAYALRYVQRTEAGLSFIVPALGAAYNGVKRAAGWEGDWSAPGDEASGGVALSKAESAPALERSIMAQFVTLPDGRRMHMVCAGQGQPAVLLDYGAGSAMKRDWAEIARLAAEKAQTKVCAYDRAGRGLSDPAPLPRDAAAVADDIDAMLTAASLPPPYILVGHSLGSYHVRQYANTRADKIAGLVLVDPSGDGQAERFNAVIPKVQKLQEEMSSAAAKLNCIGRLREKPVGPDDPFAKQCGSNDPEAIEATQSEINAMPGSSTQQLTQSRRSYGAMPLIVLTRGDYEKDMPPSFTAADRDAMKSVWEAMHAEMVALSMAGEHRHIEGAGHSIQRDKPEAVVTAIADIVAKARQVSR